MKVATMGRSIKRMRILQVDLFMLVASSFLGVYALGYQTIFLLFYFEQGVPQCIARYDELNGHVCPHGFKTFSLLLFLIGSFLVGVPQTLTNE